MPKLVNLLNKNKLTLIVALPENDPELAKAAITGGADALQLPLNIKGAGSFEEEKYRLSEIVNLVRVPVGIMPGGKIQASRDEMATMIDMGFDFFNMKMENIPPFFSELKGAAKVIGLGSRFTIDLVLGVSKYSANAVDAAIIPASEFGKNLIVGDLQNYISIVMSAGIPVIVPTQRSIKPSEVAIISDTGAKGLMLTPVVLGTSAKHVEKNVREFRVEVDDLGD